MTDQNTDTLIVGAGPCGLFQAFQLGLQGIQCHIVESQHQPGGQCKELYADKPIYDIPGIPQILAGELSKQLLTQLTPFNPVFHYETTVTGVEKRADSSFDVQLNNGTTLIAKNVILASGAGAFTPVKMRAEGIDNLTAEQLLYTQITPDKVENKSVIVSGDTVEALEAVIACAGTAGEVTFIHRKKRLPAISTHLQTVEDLAARNKIRMLQGKFASVTSKKSGVNVQITLADKTGFSVDCDVIIARLGNSPKMQDYSTWGLTTTRRHVDVNTATFQSTIDGLYAIGDINHYAGKRKLILCGFHEATLTAFDIAARLQPGQPVHTQFTTTSTQLLKRLGVLADNH